VLTCENALSSPLGDQGPRDVRFRRGLFIELAAYGFSVESPNAEFCARTCVALREGYGITDAQLRWFAMHAELDAGHDEEFRKYAARAAESPDGLRRLREQTLALCSATKMERRRLVAIAPTRWQRPRP
jgi:pyrroloquinoline quinone (PQQ) biosynthesis protein C